MADVNIDYTCGCGFRAKRLEAAVGHSETAKHTLSVLGTIRTSKSAVVVEEHAKIVSEFEQLRSKLVSKD